MPAQSNSAIVYTPGPVPSDPKQLQRYLREEFEKLAGLVKALADGHVETTYVVPPKPREGDIRLSDGTQWNPGLEGAEKMSAALTVPSVTIALPCKDSREFLQAGGTVEALDYLIGEQPWRQPHSQPSTAQLKG